MLFTFTDCYGMKYHHFLMIELVQTQLLKYCTPIADLNKFLATQNFKITNGMDGTINSFNF